MNSGYNPQFDTAAMQANMQNWGNPAASVAQPLSSPAFQVQPMSAFNGNFGQQASASMMPQQGSLSAFGAGGPQINAPQQSWGQRAGGWLGDGNNLGTVVQGLGTLTNAYLGFKQLGIAKDNLKFQKSSFAKNFANSQQTYNTSLEDRIRGRSSNPNEGDVQSYLSRHRLQQTP